jgi:glycine cleavage system aminomethyltransferase T
MLPTDVSGGPLRRAAGGRPVVAAVPQTCLAACAGLHDLGGHTVVAHYGSISGEVAVCMKSVGLADHSDYGVCELSGARELLDRALVARLGDPPLPVGGGRRLGSVWYLRLDARHTLLVGPHPAVASASAIGRGRDRGDLRDRDLGASLAIVGVVGPRASRVIAAAGLPGELPIGAVGGDAGDGTIVAILRESQRRYLALVRADAADALALLNASSVAVR